MATTSHIISSIPLLTFLSPLIPSTPPQSPSFLNLPTTTTAALAASLIKSIPPLNAVSSAPLTSTSNPTSASSSTNFYGLCYVVRDDVDTNQIIPTQHYTLNPSNPEDYKELGSYILNGFSNSYPLQFVEDDGKKSKYSIIIAGNNFGSGYLTEYGDVIDALSNAGTRAVVAESYGGVFLKRSNSSGLIYALESEVRICDEFKTGDVATIDVEGRVLVNQTTGIVYQLKAVVGPNSVG